jgi:hypothetical protein
MEKCLFCKKELKGNQKKFCSYKCNYDYNRKNYIRRRVEKEIECKGCTKKFISQFSNQLFCSTPCRDLFHREEYKKLSKEGNFDIKDGKYFAYLKIRFELFKRDNFTCQYCGRNIKEDGIKLHVEHIIAKNNGGTDEISNLTTSCDECNYEKSDILLDERLFAKMDKKR